MRTGDSCFHKPTGETWLVAFVDEARGHVAPCGWPMCLAQLTDCTLVESCSDEESEKWLQRLADMGGGHDPRKSWAQRAIADREQKARDALGES